VIRTFVRLAVIAFPALAALGTAAGQAVAPAIAQTGAGRNVIETLKAPGSLQSRLRFDHLTTADGLSNNSVFSILQDHRGFMWFGTQGGLNRYDGYRMTQYRRDGQDAHTLGDDFVMKLFEDSRGGIWCGRGVLSRFDPDTERFTRYPLPSQGSPFSDVMGIGEDPHGNIWVTTSAGCPLSRLDPKTTTFQCYEAGVRGGSALHIDAAGVLWLGTNEGLVRLDPGTGAQALYHRHSPVGGNVADSIVGIAPDASGKLWLALTVTRRPVCFDPVARLFVHDLTAASKELVQGPILTTSILPDPGGGLWL
jgi:ligand-binding sensor domain-containing protein